MDVVDELNALSYLRGIKAGRAGYDSPAGQLAQKFFNQAVAADVPGGDRLFWERALSEVV